MCMRELLGQDNETSKRETILTQKASSTQKASTTGRSQGQESNHRYPETKGSVGYEVCGDFVLCYIRSKCHERASEALESIRERVKRLSSELTLAEVEAQVKEAICSPAKQAKQGTAAQASDCASPDGCPISSPVESARPALPNLIEACDEAISSEFSWFAAEPTSKEVFDWLNAQDNAEDNLCSAPGVLDVVVLDLTAERGNDTAAAECRTRVSQLLEPVRSKPSGSRGSSTAEVISDVTHALCSELLTQGMQGQTPSTSGAAGRSRPCEASVSNSLSHRLEARPLEAVFEWLESRGTAEADLCPEFVFPFPDSGDDQETTERCRRRVSGALQSVRTRVSQSDGQANVGLEVAQSVCLPSTSSSEQSQDQSTRPKQRKTAQPLNASHALQACQASISASLENRTQQSLLEWLEDPGRPELDLCSQLPVLDIDALDLDEGDASGAEPSLGRTPGWDFLIHALEDSFGINEEELEQAVDNPPPLQGPLPRVHQQLEDISPSINGILADMFNRGIALALCASTRSGKIPSSRRTVRAALDKKLDVRAKVLLCHRLMNALIEGLSLNASVPMELTNRTATTALASSTVIPEFSKELQKLEDLQRNRHEIGILLGPLGGLFAGTGAVLAASSPAVTSLLSSLASKLNLPFGARAGTGAVGWSSRATLSTINQFMARFVSQ
ncbi:deuterolysin metalloprotease [Ophiocordyceps camponoti-floridani]|uniref:Deuterolysin metalloprotease n=1 Tax=Ophiocordyceps camponoti-floridani TaxID=2030778 RepID=A0A8H4VCY6_9HYPO|nr:deuterolysin metalloprotease [Ophiocordyceps camponoti-floridani]